MLIQRSNRRPIYRDKRRMPWGRMPSLGIVRPRMEILNAAGLVSSPTGIRANAMGKIAAANATDFDCQDCPCGQTPCNVLVTFTDVQLCTDCTATFGPHIKFDGSSNPNQTICCTPLGGPCNVCQWQGSFSPVITAKTYANGDFDCSGDVLSTVSDFVCVVFRRVYPTGPFAGQIGWEIECGSATLGDSFFHAFAADPDQGNPSCTATFSGSNSVTTCGDTDPITGTTILIGFNGSVAGTPGGC